MASAENENEAAQVYLLGKTYLANNQGQFYIRADPIAHLAAGDQHTIIVTESGRAFAFGANSSGRMSEYSLESFKLKMNLRSIGTWTYKSCRKSLLHQKFEIR